MFCARLASICSIKKARRSGLLCVQGYGSCVSNADAPESDLDLSIDGSFVSRSQKIDMVCDPATRLCVQDHMRLCLNCTSCVPNYHLANCKQFMAIHAIWLFLPPSCCVDCGVSIGDRQVAQCAGECAI